VAADGTRAECTVPFRPSWDPAAAGADPLAAAVEHCLRQRQIGVLLVRLGGFAVGVFDGEQLRASKVGARHVQGRSAAGGWSQQRFARRRANQAEQALAAAADAAEAVLTPVAAALDAVVLGGDRRAVERVLADRRLVALARAPVEPRLLDVPDPRRDVLLGTPDRFRAVRIRVVETA
jgi:hypothetical protein